MSADKDQKDLAPDFRYEIKCMMYSFGDGKHPYPQSVALVEKITRSQIAEMVSKTVDMSCLKGKRSVAVDDILFLLRKNTSKLRSLSKYLQTKEVAKDMAKSAKVAEINEPMAVDHLPSKKRKYSLDFLSQSDQASVESQNPDISSLQRMDEITKEMNASEYMYYSKCRQVNFFRQTNFQKNTQKFIEWLDLSSLTDFKLSQEVIEVFGYLAYETVREIVELSLQVKEDIEHNDMLRARISHHHCPSLPSQFGTTPTFFTVPTDSNYSPPISPNPQPPPPERSSSPCSPVSASVNSRKQSTGQWSHKDQQSHPPKAHQGGHTQISVPDGTNGSFNETLLQTNFLSRYTVYLKIHSKLT